MCNRASFFCANALRVLCLVISTCLAFYLYFSVACLYQTPHISCLWPTATCQSALPAASLHKVAHGDAAYRLQHVISRLEGMRDARALQHNRLADSVEADGWESWTLTELSKHSYLNEDFTLLIDKTTAELGALVKTCRTLQEVHAVVKDVERECAGAESFLEAKLPYFRAWPGFRNPRDPALNLKLCEQADRAVKGIADLAKGYPQSLFELNGKLSEMRVTINYIYNTAGSAAWRASLDPRDNQCVVQKKTIAECGSEGQKMMMSDLLNEHLDYQMQLTVDIYLVRSIFGQVQAACKHFQAAQLARNCFTTVQCHQLPYVPPAGRTRSPKEMASSFSAWLESLLWPGIPDRQIS